MQALTRRDFVKLSTAAAAAASSSLFSTRAFASPMGLPLGIQLYTVRAVIGKDTPGTLKALYDLGFREVEPAGSAGHTMAEMGKMIKDAGLVAPSAHVELSDPARLSQSFDDCHALGTHYATSSALTLGVYPRVAPAPLQPGEAPRPFRSPQETLDMEHWQKMAEKMNTIGTAAKAAGLQYAYHSHNHEMTQLPDGSRGLDVLLKNTDHGLVNFEIDCGWMEVGGGDPVHYLGTYPGRFKMLHVKDFLPIAHPITEHGNGGENPTGTELGHGFIKYQPIFDAGKKAGVEHAFSEQEAPYTPEQMGAAAEDARAMKAFH